MSDTRTEKDGGTWSDGGKSYEPPVRKVIQRPVDEAKATLKAVEYVGAEAGDVVLVNGVKYMSPSAVSEAIAREVEKEREECARAAFIPLQRYVDSLRTGYDPEAATYMILKEAQEAIRSRSKAEK